MTGPAADDLPGYVPLVREAAARLGAHLVRTPLVPSPGFSRRFGFPAYLKLENLQVTGAFKIRGAMNRVLALKEAGVRHVIAASSGSHAMGISLAARILGLKATIVMAETSPELKRRKVLSYGPELVVEGRTYDDSAAVAEDLARRTGAALVSGLEDEDVMIGHGTLGLEILADLPEVDFAVVPVGGGGAIAGLLMALKGSRPEVRVWGVQASGAPSMKVSLEKGRPTELERVETIADAIAVRRPGSRPFRLVWRFAEGLATADDGAMIRAVGRLALWDKVVAEPAAAAPLAVDWNSVLTGRPAPKAAVFVVTGGNVPKELLARAVGEGEEDAAAEA